MAASMLVIWVAAIVGLFGRNGRVDSISGTGPYLEDVLRTKLTAVFDPAEEGGYVVTFPAIPGLATQGETMEEARGMAEDCLRAYLESLAKDGEPMPYEEPELPRTEKVRGALAAA